VVVLAERDAATRHEDLPCTVVPGCDAGSPSRWATDSWDTGALFAALRGVWPRILITAAFLVACDDVRAPDRPVEAALFLALLDEETGDPVELELQLWRLGVAADDVWTRGDRLEARCRIPAGGRWIDDLPPGRYRIYSPSLRRGSEDPPAFDVAGVEVRLRLFVPACRTRRLIVRVLDEAGRPLDRATCEWRGSSSWSRCEAELPPWHVPRRRHDGRCEPRQPSGSVRACGLGGKPFDIVAGPWGFDLGPCPDVARNSGDMSSYELRFEGRSSVSLHLTSDRPRDPVFEGVALPAGFANGSVLLPDGGLAAVVHLECDAVPAGAETVPVEVHVRGFAPVVVAYQPGLPFPLCRLRKGA